MKCHPEGALATEGTHQSEILRRFTPQNDKERVSGKNR